MTDAPLEDELAWLFNEFDELNDAVENEFGRHETRSLFEETRNRAKAIQARLNDILFVNVAHVGPMPEALIDVTHLVTPKGHREFIVGEIEFRLPSEWREKLESLDPETNVRLKEGERVTFDGTAAELLARLTD